MPKVRSIGSQSARREGRSGGRAATAFNPASVSCKPLRKNHPRTQRSTLATNGTRQPQEATWFLVSKELTSQAEPEPRMKPMVTPAAVELLMRPRVSGDADSVV